MKLEPINKINLLKAAIGEIPCDLVITNIRMVNVFSGECYPANVYVYEGFIAHVETKMLKGPYFADHIYDGKGNFLIPGLIDAHMHIESSMMVPRNFAKAVIPHGTTTIIHDPHELANVYGVLGVTYMHDCAEGLPMRQLVDIPSCVPSVPECEHAGAQFLEKEIEELAKLDRVIGLAEVMDYIGVIHGEDRMMNIIESAKKNGLYIQGHAPGISGRELSAYLCGGPTTCHETTRGEEAIEKIRNGMYVDARESSISKDIEAIWSGIKDLKCFDYLTLCSDDRESDDILQEGHMNAVVRKIISCGMDPILAIKSATINTAKQIQMEHLGAIAPGYVADMVIVATLEEMNAGAVFFGGKLVAEDGVLLAEIKDKTYEIEKKNSVVVKPLTIADFTIKVPIQEGIVLANVMTYENLTSSITECTQEEITVSRGLLQLPEGIMFVAVVNRHEGKDTMALHLVRNFGSTHGAIASTVSHDSHNLTIVYDTPENALIAANQLIETGGGMVAVENQKILHTLKLEVGGLMTRLEAADLAKEAKIMKKAERKLGLTQPNPLVRIVTLALVVIPEVKISDCGLIDVASKSVINLIESVVSENKL